MQSYLLEIIGLLVTYFRLQSLIWTFKDFHLLCWLILFFSFLKKWGGIKIFNKRKWNHCVELLTMKSGLSVDNYVDYGIELSNRSICILLGPNTAKNNIIKCLKLGWLRGPNEENVIFNDFLFYHLHHYDLLRTFVSFFLSL